MKILVYEKTNEKIDHKCNRFYNVQIDGLVQNCSNSIANALELLQSCTKPSKWLPLLL